MGFIQIPPLWDSVKYSSIWCHICQNHKGTGCSGLKTHALPLSTSAAEEAVAVPDAGRTTDPCLSKHFWHFKLIIKFQSRWNSEMIAHSRAWSWYVLTLECRTLGHPLCSCQWKTSERSTACLNTHQKNTLLDSAEGGREGDSKSEGERVHVAYQIGKKGRLPWLSSTLNI